MSLRVDYSVLNQRETPSLFADVFSNRPAFGFNGRLFISIDTKQIFRDYGTNWELIADAGSGSSNLQQVCTNGNFTTTDIDMLSGNLILRNLNPGGVLFTNTSEIVSQDINNFFWDDTNNRLGIGTNTPTAPLDVHSTGNILQQLNGTSTNNTYLAFLNQDIGKWRIGNYYNSGDNDFVIYDTFSGVTRAFFTNTGYTILPTNLIIGSSNRSSAYGMDVYVSANYQSTLRVQGASTFLSQINGTFAVFSGDLTIATNKFFVNSSTGNIGMGTITPEANSNNTTLQIDGTNSSFVRTGTSAYGGYFATIPTADVMVLSNVRNPVTGAFSNINKACSQMSLWGASGDGYITFSTSPTNNGAPVERLRITSGGDVCIGTTTVNDKLTIDGGIRSIGSSSGYFWNDRSNAANFYGWYATSNVVYFFNGSANAAQIIPSTGVYTPLSDINKKKDFEASAIGLNEILNLKPTLYRMKSDETNGNKELGFIAQEVKDFIPQAFVESGDDNNKFIGLNYNAIVAALVKSVQELKAEIEELKNK